MFSVPQRAHMFQWLHPVNFDVLLPRTKPNVDRKETQKNKVKLWIHILSLTTLVKVCLINLVYFGRAEGLNHLIPIQVSRGLNQKLTSSAGRSYYGPHNEADLGILIAKKSSSFSLLCHWAAFIGVKRAFLHHRHHTFKDMCALSVMWEMTNCKGWTAVASKCFLFDWLNRFINQSIPLSVVTTLQPHSMTHNTIWLVKCSK